MSFKVTTYLLIEPNPPHVCKNEAGWPIWLQCFFWWGCTMTPNGIEFPNPVRRNSAIICNFSFNLHSNSEMYVPTKSSASPELIPSAVRGTASTISRHFEEAQHEGFSALPIRDHECASHVRKSRQNHTMLELQTLPCYYLLADASHLDYVRFFRPSIMH